MKPKNKYISFNNPEAVAVYNAIRDRCHARDQYAWQVIRDGLQLLDCIDFLEKSKESQPEKEGKAYFFVLEKTSTGLMTWKITHGEHGSDTWTDLTAQNEKE